PGNSTRILAERWPIAQTTGVDNSVSMIDVARREQPKRLWAARDITHWALEEKGLFDVVFSNAALQWVPDHASLYPKLFDRLAPVPRGSANRIRSRAVPGRVSQTHSSRISHPPGRQDHLSVPPLVCRRIQRCAVIVSKLVKCEMSGCTMSNSLGLMAN